MARGAAQQQNLLNSAGTSMLDTAKSLYSNVKSGFDSIIKSPGFSKDQINSQMNAAITPIAGQIASGKNAMLNRAGATRNTAGLTAGERDLSRSGAQLESQAAWGVENNADNVALRERDNALEGESSLYSPTLSSAGNLYSNATNAMSDRKSVLDNIQQGVNIFRTAIPAPKG